MNLSREDGTRLLEVLEALLEMPATSLAVALTHAADLVASNCRADKVDAFLHDPARDSLVAIGVSNQPLSEQERQHGLDVLPVANGGRVVWVFQTGETYVNGHVDEDEEELIGIRDALGIRSKMGVPLRIAGQVRGVIMIASRQPEHFGEEDVRFAESVARFVGIVAHRAELVEQIALSAREEGRRTAAEELITVLAHDLRNHIAPIDLRMQVLHRRADRDGRGEDVRDLEATRRSLARLMGLLTDILDVSRVDRGIFAIDVQPVDVVELLQEVAATFSSPAHPIDVRTSSPLTLAGDTHRIRQCLENIVANSVRHSPAGAPVTVLIAHEKHADGEWARIEVIDEGPGIAPDVLPHIFERFVTSGNRQGGLGLGLYLSKRIAVMHGGDLTVESLPGRGARFVLRLPTGDGAEHVRSMEEPLVPPEEARA
jgi:two-component system, OmpR family, sensor kinase